MSLSLKRINSRLAEEFIHLKKYCNYEENYLDNGIALQNKQSKRIFCFMYYDLFRGRGEYVECQGSGCKYYCYVNPNQRKLTEFLEPKKKSHQIYNKDYPKLKEKIERIFNSDTRLEESSRQAETSLLIKDEKSMMNERRLVTPSKIVTKQSNTSEQK